MSRIEQNYMSRSIKELEQTAKFSSGNSKLVPNEQTAFLIWNLPYKITCPYATELCKSICYAKKAEDLYPDCNPSRNRNFEFSRTAEFTAWAIALISKKLQNCKKKGKKLVVRIHESGDFYNDEYFLKWMYICTQFEQERDITFIAYTKSMPYVAKYLRAFNKLPSRLALRFSVMKDTNPTFIELAEKYNLSIYTADAEQNINEQTYPNYDVCRCSDCATCGHCWSRDDRYHKIVCAIH